MTLVKHLVIRGRVQGVGFRFHTDRVAQELGVAGWVRNRRDGSVEAMVSGTPKAVEKIIAWARHGPRLAIVTGIEINEGTGSFSNFECLPTE